MKIIKPGNLEKSKKWMRGNCTDCGCIIECEQKEAKIDYDPRDNYSCFYYKCPTCGYAISLQDKK
jgi:hypothetical protein